MSEDHDEFDDFDDLKSNGNSEWEKKFDEHGAHGVGCAVAAALVLAGLIAGIPAFLLGGW